MLTKQNKPINTHSHLSTSPHHPTIISCCLKWALEAQGKMEEMTAKGATSDPMQSMKESIYGEHKESKRQSMAESIHILYETSACYESVHAIDTQFNLEYQFPTTRPRLALPKREALVSVKLIVATLSVATLKAWSPSWRPFQRGESRATEAQCLVSSDIIAKKQKLQSLFSLDKCHNTEEHSQKKKKFYEKNNLTFSHNRFIFWKERRPITLKIGKKNRATNKKRKKIGSRGARQNRRKG